MEQPPQEIKQGQQQEQEPETFNKNVRIFYLSSLVFADAGTGCKQPVFFF
jgi:hypothetical protein